MRSAAVLLASALLAVVSIALPGCDGRGAGDGSSAAAGSSMGPLEPSTNRQGRDLARASQRTETAAQCSDLCAATAACRAMSFARSEGDKGGICLLKSDVPEPTENPAVTSAVKAASAPASGP